MVLCKRVQVKNKLQSQVSLVAFLAKILFVSFLCIIAIHKPTVFELIMLRLIEWLFNGASTQ
jgi:hypothetical protein